MSQVRYQPLGPLLAGEGSRAFLGLALEDGAPPRAVVLVWAPPEVVKDPELSAQLENETRTAVNLEHPNILRVHGLVSLDSGLARVTEFADGESLRRLLEVRSRIPPAFAALITADVAMGIHYAHLAGNDDGSALVHGDLRPETVMVSFNGVCKVSGYGALNVAPRERNGRRVRNRRHYSAPEQLLGGREAMSPRTDVFLLGLLLYECLSGRMPYQDASDPDKAILERPLPAIPSDVPRPLAEVVRRATAKRASERFDSALEFREAVVAAVQGLPSAETFADFLSQLFPPDRDARATRRQMLEMGLNDATRRASATGLPAVQPAPAQVVPLPQRASGGVPPVATLDAKEQELDVEVSFQDEDADALDSALEQANTRASPPGVARPLPRETRPKRRTPVAYVAALLASAAAVGGFLLWSDSQQAAPTPASTRVASATPEPEKKPALPAPEPEVATALAGPVDAGVPSDTASAQLPPGDAGTPSEQGSAPAVALAAGPAPASPGGTVVPTSGTEAAEVKVTTRLKLVVMPPVEVTLDGKPLGRTPLTVPLAPGEYALELSNPAKGVRKTTRTVTVGPKGTTKKRLVLGKGSVLVRAPKGSRIFVDGRKAGPKLKLYEGEHLLVVTSAKGARWEKPFTLEARQRMTLKVENEKP